MKNILGLFALWTAGWISAPALAQKIADPRAERIIATVEALMGPRAAIGGFTTLVTQAHSFGPDTQYMTITRSNGDGDAALIQIFADRRFLAGVFDGASWSINEASGVVTEGTDFMRAYVPGHEFHLTLMRLRSRFTDHAYAGSRDFHGCDCDEVTMRNPFGAASVFVSRADGRPWGMQTRLESRDAPIDIVYRDWIERDGGFLFTRFILTDGDDLYTYHYAQIAFDAIAENAVTPEAIARDFAPDGAFDGRSQD